ncbi:nitrogenase component 1 [Methanobacterium sp.]|uniref:nitrogenase component 1 n=1 Tax=Methanobacterium sp. TaxID=2164 RepID=UPI0025CCE240|nr:nitrogenase component 1 [Methanobacterium sp.]MBI5459921.1 nitrogenase molybdenum-iron protein subunit beta [Methanobacterium sp.]
MSCANVMKRDRTAVINPLVTCQPMGAMYAVAGIRRGLPLVHGSQGCSTFVRYSFSRHFREPSEIAVTSLHEDAAVFGGRKNLISGIGNLAVRFKPSVIGAISTCSSEIIGDDMEGFIKIAREDLKKKMGEKEAGKIKIVPISTPSFVENHFRGYDNAIKALVTNLAQDPGDANEKINMIPGMVNPGDVREIKHIMSLMGVEGIVLTDISDPFDSPLRPSATETRPFYPKGGTTVEEIADSSNSLGTISLCGYAGSGALSLEKKYDVPAAVGPIPIGVQNTDQFLRNLKKFTDLEIPDSILDERGLLIDSMADLASRYLFGRKVAIFGDPAISAGIARFVCELGMIPSVVCTGVENPEFVSEMEKVAKESDEPVDVMIGSDLRALEVRLEEDPVELMIGHSDGRLFAKHLNIPLVRVGYPVYDRAGYHRVPIVGYNGSVNLIDRITNTVFEKYYDKEHWKLQQ